MIMPDTSNLDALIYKKRKSHVLHSICVKKRKIERKKEEKKNKKTTNIFNIIAQHR